MKGMRTMSHPVGSKMTYMACQSTLHDIHKASFVAVLGQKTRRFAPCRTLDSIVAYEYRH